MFAFMSDLHIGHYSEFDVNGSRLHRCIDALRQVYNACYGKAAAIIDCGDLIDKKNHIDFTTYNPVFQTFDDLYAPNVMSSDRPDFHTLVGNHNMAKLNDPKVNNLVPLQKHINVIDEPCIITKYYDYYGLLMAFIPYRRSLAQWWEDYAKVSAEIEAYKPYTPICSHPMRKVLIAHQEIKGAVTGTHRYVASGGVDFNQLPGPFDWCIFGHYHKCQFLSPNVFYCGALLQQEFGEEGNAQGFWWYDPATNRWDFQMIQTPHFFTIEGTAPDSYNYYRCRITEEPTEKQSNVRYEPMVDVEQETRLQVSNQWSTNELIEAYLQARVPEDRHAEIRNLVNSL